MDGLTVSSPPDNWTELSSALRFLENRLATVFPEFGEKLNETYDKQKITESPERTRLALTMSLLRGANAFANLTK